MIVCTVCGAENPDDAKKCPMCNNRLPGGVAPAPTPSVAQSVPQGSADMEERWKQAEALYSNKQYAEAVPLLEALANEGHAEAQLYFGVCLRNGKGVESDAEKALEWVRKAAKQGNEDAKFMYKTYKANM